MNNLFQYILESTILLTFFYLFYHILLRKEKCFQYNRIYLITTPILAILFPLLDLRQLIAGSQNEVSAVLPSVVLPEVNFTTPSSTTDSLSGIFLFLGILYAIGFLFYAIRLTIHLIRINRLISENHHSITTLGSAQVVPIEGEIPTFSFFNYIFWNEKITLTEQEKEQIYKHELIHISEKHSYDILYFEILSMIFWFNPVLLLFKRAITDTHEFIADSKVTLKFSGKSYAALLVKLSSIPFG